MASHILSRLSSYETQRRRNLVRKVLLESLERRELMAADLWNGDESSSYTSTLTDSVLSQASLSFSSLNPNLSGYDVTSFLDSTLGSASGDLTNRPWFGLIQESYNQWSQDNGLAFSYTSRLQAEGEEGRLNGEGEVGGPRLLSVAPNASSIFTFNSVNTLSEAPTELTLRFDDELNVSNLRGIRLRATGGDGVFGANDPYVTPGWIGAIDDDNTSIIVMRFASTLADDLYRVELEGTGNNAVTSASGRTLATRQFDSTPSDTTIDSVDFRLQLGAKVLAVVPQPVDRLPNGALQVQANKVRVYFNNDKLDPASAQNINYYQLIHTADSVEPGDDRRFLPTSAVYDQSQNMVELTFSHDINSLPGAGPGTYRLRVGSSDVVNSIALPANLTEVAEVTEVPSNIQSARDLGIFAGTTSILRSGTVVTTSVAQLQLDFPGSNFEPGHRDIQAESHLAGSADANPQITTIQYNFAETRSYGVNAVNQPVFSSMTPDQKQRVREAFEFYANKLGVTFQETEAAGLTIVLGDLFPIGGTRSEPGGAGLVADPVMTQMAILDGAETWDNTFGGNFFLASMHAIGLLIGYGIDSDLPVGSVMRIETATSINTGLNLQAFAAFNAEPVYPGDHDVVHGQHMFRPDNRDVDSYRFVIPAGQAGKLRIESLAERLSTSSSLNTHLTLFKMTAAGPEVVATNDNSFGTDSYIALDLEPQTSNVTYFVSITGKGNEDFDPLVPNTGSGANTQGAYQLRVNFDSTAAAGLFMQDTSGTALDGDGNGQPGGAFNFWFRAAAASTGAASTNPRTIYVDKSFTGVGNGSPSQPMNNLNFAQWPAASRPVEGDIVRVLGSTASDPRNIPAYEIGRGGVGNAVLSDGLTLQVPKGVTMMIDAGAMFKLQASQISTGSATASVDNSNSALQVLGIPGNPVLFTSYKDESMGIDTNPIGTTPVAGDWGGLLFRESVDRSQGRFGWESKGIFLNYVSSADIRYGGGSVTVLSPSQVVAPITLSESRPTILNNTITRSADAAISADPNSFEETLFTTPIYQLAENFDPDYSRVGPDIRGNTITDNSLNGLFVRTTTAAGGPQATLTVSGKFNDTDIVHVVAENLIIDSQPGGSIIDPRGLDVSLVQLLQQSVAGGTFTAGTNIRYKLTAIDRFGNTSPASVATAPVTITGANNTIRLSNLPAATGDFVGRRLWRSTDGGVTYRLVAELDKSTATFVDNGSTKTAVLANANATTNERARPNGRLEIAPGTVIKATGARIEVAPGATFLAEGTSEDRIIFTSRSDDKYGAGGTFDTYNDGTTLVSRGDWGGIMGRHLSTVSIDYALIAFGGGIAPLPGGFAGFNALELDQANARVANTRFESNANGAGGNLSANRVGRGPNDASVINVGGSQPVIVNNVFVDNDIANTAAISINANALNTVNVIDRGRQTGLNDRLAGSVGNVGPLVRGNVMSNTGINGMRVRGQELTTESVWDDADIVHVLQSEVIVPDFHTFGGLTLRSRFDEGLVVKLFGANAGFTATGKPLDVADRIGGSLRIVGTPGFPVVLTSLADDTVGAGNDTFGRPLLDTNNDANAPVPAIARPGDWRSITLNPYANDRNVVMTSERESDQLQDVGTNDDVDTAQGLGGLAATLSGGDENLRLGFSIDGSVASTQDLDVYSFTAKAGTPVWLDIDRTSGALDSVVELLDSSGNILALSNQSLSESLGTSSRFVSIDPTKILPEQVRGLDSDPSAPRNSLAPTMARDLYSTNPNDAGMHIVLPGTANQDSTYYVRVRSSNLGPTDPATKLQDVSQLRSGITKGTYRLQVRLRQTDEVPGSTVQNADIRFATTGISVIGLPSSSPLLGQISETGNTNLGNIGNTDRGSISVAGNLSAANQIDTYSFTVSRDDVVSGDHVSFVFDIDYADGLGRPDTTLWIFNSAGNLVFTGTNSNIADDQVAPSNSNGVRDLTRGSAGTRDAYIGPVELIPGTYTVAVTNTSRVSQKVTQGLVRREPLDSVRRISIDRFNNIGVETTNSPLQVTFGTDLTQHRVEWNLSDITTYVVSDSGNGSLLSFANAMSGDKVADIRTFPRVNDIATSPRGDVVGFQVQTTAATTDANGGTFLLIDSPGFVDASIDNTAIPNGAQIAGASGIVTFTTQRTGATTFAVQPRDHTGFADGNTPQGDAIVFNALGFHTSGPSLGLFGVGSRGNGQTTFNIGDLDANNAVILGGTSNVTTNLVYRLNPDTGAAINPNGVADRTATVPLDGAGTNKVEWGRFLTTGVVRGLAEINGTLFAVSSLGEIFLAQVGTNPANAFGNRTPNTTLIDPETGTAIAFNGLTRGPRNLSNPLGGNMGNLLFGTTANGTIYAIDVTAMLANPFAVPTLAPVFPGFSYKTRVPGALGTGVSGIDFSALDVNLWHLTNFRATDPGHGRGPTPTGSQTGTAQGSNSLYFGFRDPAAGPSQQGNWSGVYSTVAPSGTYNTPGGAHGAIVSNPIDLSNYSPDDQPMMYFNYRLNTENQNNDFQQTSRMRDAFRVYGAGDDGQWVLLASNNTASDGGNDRGNPTGGAARNGRFDELDNTVNGNFDAFGAPVLSQEIIDAVNPSDTWRQARVPLAALAGRSNIRLRFEFSTAATFETGDPLRGGVELVAVAGNRIVDGTGFTMTPNSITGFAATNFEFDHGLVLALPGGASLVDGVSTITVNGTVLTFSTTSNAGNNIQYVVTDSAVTLAQKVGTALQNKLGIAATRITFDPARPNIMAVSGLPTPGVYGVGGGLSTADIVLGTPGVTAGSVAIPVNLAMTANQVRDAMRLSFAQTFSQANMLANFGVAQAANAWPFTGNTVLVYKFDVANNTSAIGLTTSRIGDFFGVDKGGVLSHNEERAARNNFEGVYIDDIIISFAERGEMVSNDVDTDVQGGWINSTEFYQDLYGINQITTGSYQLNIRTAADYGTSAGSSLALNSFPPLGRDFDTNARLSKTYGIFVPAAAAGRIVDGLDINPSDSLPYNPLATFTLSDRKNVLTFEFDLNAGATDAAFGVAQGHVRVPITPSSTSHDIASAIVNAINSSTVQQLLGLTASIQGQAAGVGAGTIIELHGPAATDLNGGFAFPASTQLVGFINGRETSFGEDLGDLERERAQGQILLVNNSITNSRGFGIVSDAGAQNQQNGSGPRPYPGAPINFPTLNTAAVAPGIVIANNILANNASGVLVSDDPALGTTNPIARIINNTFFGGQFGVQLANGAAPMIVNNIFAETSGLSVNPGTSTAAVLGANVYSNSAQSALPESFGIQAAGTVFVSTTNGKFYLANGSPAIDASLNVLQERNELTLVKNSLFLPLSPMLAPEDDINGQTRLDDPAVASPNGMGSNVFIDRGAVERADFDGPIAVIVRPQDNDSLNVDADRNRTYIRTQEADLNSFSFLMQDFNGTGPDPATMISSAVVLTENGRVLRDGSDYVFGYNANSRTLRLTPLAGVWRNDSVYEITLNNTDGHRVIVPDARINNVDRLRDGDRLVVVRGATTVTLEFDNNGSSSGVAIPFTANSTGYQLSMLISHQLNLAGMTSRLEGDGSLFIVGATSVTATTAAASDVIAVSQVAAIRDLAGNILNPNRPTNLTQFTIVMPEAELDYGDSPGARIPTIESATAFNGNGARNVILPIDYPLLALGTWVDSNADGLPSRAADADNYDTVVDFGTLGGVTQGPAGSARLQMAAPGLINGQSIAITDKVIPLVFRFTTSPAVGGPNLIDVDLNGTVTAEDVADRFAAAVRQALIDAKIAGVIPIADGAFVSLGGSSSHQFDVSLAPSVVRLKQGPVDMMIPSSLATLADGQTMRITDSRGRQVTFELNDTSAPSTVVAGNAAVNVNLTTATPTIVAQAFVSAINAQVAAGRLGIGGATLFGTSTVRILGNDEDGVTFDGLFNAGSPPVATFVTATDFGMLDVWVDWTGDDDFADANERVFSTSVPVQPGVNRILIQTPANAVTGFTTARFRLSTLGGLLSEGVGVGGEVEDYLIEIAPGRPPVSIADTYSVVEDGVLTRTGVNGVLANDTDADVVTINPGVNIFVNDENPTTLALEPVVNVTNGTLALNADGSFTYTPFANFNGIDTFVYRATDGRLLGQQVTVTISVSPVNDAPIANDDTLTVFEDSTVNEIGTTFTANDFAHFLLQTSSTGFQTNESGQVLTLTGAQIISAESTSFGIVGTSVRFAAKPGQGLYGLRVSFTSADLGTAVLPQVAVVGTDIRVTLNSNAGTPSTINDMIVAIANNVAANGLIDVSLVTGSSAAVIGTLSSVAPVVVPPSGGTVSVVNNRLLYVAPANYNNSIGGPVKLLLTIADDNTAGPTFNLTATSTLTLNITPVNDAPSFLIPAPVLTLNEDVGLVNRANFATSIVPGPSTAFDEVPQTLNFVVVSNSNPGLFTTAPTLSPTGTLTFATAPDANGQAIVVVRLRDSGAGTGNGNVNISTDQTFTINLTPVNDAPQFTLSGSTVTSREDQGLVQAVDFLTGILPGPATAVDEVGQSVTVVVVAIDPTKFSVQPTIGVDGRLVYQTATDVNELNANLEVRVTLTDNGSGVAPNQNSVETTFTIQATPVNDAPVFSITNRNVVVNEDVGSHQAVMIGSVAAGPATAPDEATQSLTFTVVSVSTPELFSQQPTVTTVGNTGRLNFATAPNKNGTAVVVVRLEDGGSSTPPNVNASGLQTFTITINPINDAPEFVVPGSITIDEDQGLVSVNSFATGVRRGPVGADDENGQVLQFVVTAVDPTLFSVQPRIAVDGTLVFQLADNVNTANAALDGKSLAVRVQLQDSGLGAPSPNTNISTTRTFTVIANPINDSPQAPGYLVSADEDQDLSISSADVLLLAVGGPTSDELSQSVFMEQVERVSLRGGTVEPQFDANNRITSLLYTPPSNASGSDSFVYVLRDNGNPARSGTATIVVNIISVNDPPQFTIGANQTSIEDFGLVTINNWATNILPGPLNDADERATQTVTFTVVADNPSLFLVQPAVASDGTLTYQSARDANGTSVIRVTAFDNGVPIKNSPEQLATITVTALNDAPVFTPGSNFSVAEDSGLTLAPNWATQIAPAAGLLASPVRALDEQGQIIDFTVSVDRPELFSILPAISSSGELSFTTAQNAFGIAVLTIRAVDRGASDGLNQNTSTAATVTINITGTNDAPVAVNDSYTTDENSVLTVAAVGLLGNDFDVDGSTDSISAVARTLRSNLDAVVTINADGSFTYDPSNVPAIQRMTTGQSMTDTFTYTAIDNSGSANNVSNVAVVTIRVNGVNDSPIAVDDSFSIGVGQTRLLAVLGNDTDIDSTIDSRTIQITRVPIFGTVTVNQTGVVQYAAEAGFRGTDTFGYVVRDELGAVSNEAIVTVIVNNPPVANPDVTFTYKDETIVIPVLANDNDVDGSLDASTVEIVVLPTPSGTATVLSNGSIQYTPGTGFSGDVTLSYVVSDNVGTVSNVARVSIRVLNSKWQNPVQSLDVNNDGRITPIDALLVINYLNDPTRERFLPNTGLVPPPYLDTDGNERVSPNDALLVVNYLNARSAGGGGEGEASDGMSFYAMMVTPQQMVDTVGAAVVRDVERMLAQLREEALAESNGLAWNPNSSSSQDSTDEEWLQALLPSTEEKAKRKTNNIDRFFEDLLGSQLN